MQTLKDLGEHFRQSFGVFEGNQWGLPPQALMDSWITQESSWNPWATREERGFFKKYVLPIIKRDVHEQWDRATSFGLGQMMGQVAREQGFEGKYLSMLLEPGTNLYYCCRYLADDRRRRTDGTWAGALAAYNGGLGRNRRPPYRNQSYVDEIVHRAQEIVRHVSS